MSALRHLSSLVAALLREDERRCLMGEDVRNGGMLGLSKAAAEDEDLRPRLLGSPLTNAAQVVHAGGLALAGLRPIVLLPSSSALLEALAALRELGRLPWRRGGRHAEGDPQDGNGNGESEPDEHPLPVLFVAPNGPGFGLGGEASESVEASLAGVPGLELWSAGRVEDLCPYLRSAADFDAATSDRIRVLLLPRSVLVTELEPPEGETEVEISAPLGRPPTATLRAGDRATVFAWGASVGPALRAAERCAAGSDDAPGFEVRVVEVGRLAPLDEDLLVEAADATGKLVIAHSGPRSHGLGAELAALFAERSILHLDAPVLRVCGDLDSSSSTGHAESSASPTSAAIAAALHTVVHY